MNEEDGEVGDKSLGSYLQQIVLLTDADDDKGECRCGKTNDDTCCQRAWSFQWCLLADWKKHFFPMP